jgi:hypothetical protein
MNDIYEDIESFDGPEVSRALFLETMADASLFHYAGHSALDGTNALSSSILLDGNVEGPNTVRASEIASRRLATNALVVLASCDSSVGNSIGGIGFRGLTSAFLVAGAGSVVGSLWPVESTATTQLMLRFHRDLASGTTIAESFAFSTTVSARGTSPSLFLVWIYGYRQPKCSPTGSVRHGGIGYGNNRTFPVVFRPSRALWASAASESGYVFSIRSFRSPALYQRKRSFVRAKSSSRFAQ